MIPFVVLFGIWEFLGFDITAPASHDFALFLDTSGEEFFSGNWVGSGWSSGNWSSSRSSARTCFSEGFCCRECGASLEGAIS